MSFQIQIAKKNDTLPMSRDYMAKCEKALEMRDMGHREKAPAAKPTRRRKVTGKGGMTCVWQRSGRNDIDTD